MVIILKILAIVALGIVVFYAVIGALFMHMTKYDYEASIENCRELVTLYEEE